MQTTWGPAIWRVGQLQKPGSISDLVSDTICAYALSAVLVQDYAYEGPPYLIFGPRNALKPSLVNRNVTVS
jgi:hypothetical protein